MYLPRQSASRTPESSTIRIEVGDGFWMLNACAMFWAHLAAYALRAAWIKFDGRSPDPNFEVSSHTFTIAPKFEDQCTEGFAKDIELFKNYVTKFLLPVLMMMM